MILISYEIKFWKTVTKMTLHKLSNIQWSSYRQLCPTHMYNLTKMVGNYRWGWGCGSNDRKIWRPLIAFYGLLFSNQVVSDSATPWTTACQTSLSFTISQSLLKLMFIELVMLSNHLSLESSFEYHVHFLGCIQILPVQLFTLCFSLKWHIL